MAQQNSSSSAGFPGPQDAASLVQALSSKSAQMLSSSLKQQLETAQEGLNTWTQNFTEQLNVAQTSMNAFKSTSDTMFGGLATGMTRTISNAVTYSKSIGDAVDKALKSTLTAITGEAVVRALYNTGLGFYFLAIQAYDQAAQAFEAAAVFGSIAGAAGALASAVPGGSSGSTKGKSAASSKSTPSAAGTASSGSAGSNLTVMVVGEAQAATWLTQVINTGVENYDLKLVASHTKRSAPAGR
ncbi:MAG TPA: hypothetical protein VJV74_15500 [Terriglobia bacterium]|nr:hypothetical protein [Terriglobia bacterium]